MQSIVPVCTENFYNAVRHHVGAVSKVGNSTVCPLLVLRYYEPAYSFVRALVLSFLT